MAISSGISHHPCRPGNTRRRRALRIAGIAALPVAGALLLSACGAQAPERIVNLSNGSDALTPVDAPTPSAVATLAGRAAGQAAAKVEKATTTAARSASSKSSGGTSTSAFTSSKWKVDFFDSFNGSSLNRKLWGTYAGSPQHDAISTWSSSMVQVTGGNLVLKAQKVNGRWVTGGVSNAVAGGKAYGRWSIKYRIPKAAGISYVILLYPANGGWPPEYDIAEDYDGGNRSQAMTTLHWSSSNQQKHAYLKGDFSQWTTVTETSTPGRTEIDVNGTKQLVINSRAGVPSIPMWMGIQTQVNHCTSASSVCVDSSTPSSTAMQIAWVSHQKYVG